MKIALVGNCQVATLAACLRQLLPEADITDVWLEGSRVEEQKESRARIGSFDFVCAHPVHSGLFEMVMLRESARQFALIPPLAFTGFQPDNLVIAQVRGPMGPNHSAIIVSSWLLGLAPDRCAKLFNAFVYGSLGYFDRFAEARQFFFERSADCGSPLEQSFSAWPAPFMYDVYHPVFEPLASLAESLAQRIARRAVDGDWDEAPARKLFGEKKFACWPLYPEIAAQLGLPPGDMRFRGAHTTSGIALNYFIDGSYDVYEKSDRKILAEAVAIELPILRELTKSPRPTLTSAPTRELHVVESDVAPAGASSPAHASCVPRNRERRPRMESWKSKQAIKNYTTGQNFSIWGSNQIAADGPYQIAEPGQGGARIYKSDFEPHFTAKFSLGSNARVFTAGSCFAREIELALLKKNIDVLSWRPDVGLDNGVLNRYTTHAIVGDFKMALSGTYDPENIVPYGKKWIDFTGHGEADTKEEMLEQRLKVLDLYKNAERADVIVLTLGLVEVWYDTQTRQYTNIPPWGQFMGSRFEMRVTDYQDNLAAMQEFVAYVRQRIRPDLKIILTVSPVPLSHTFSGKDIVAANAYSKAVLRAVAQDIVNNDPDIDYFPSYEMVTQADPATAWYPDFRHVRRDFVERIMDLFQSKYLA